jgi:large subunit ribosomal protein L31
MGERTRGSEAHRALGRASRGKARACATNFRLLGQGFEGRLAAFSKIPSRSPMKADLHPEYSEAVIQCTCGSVIQTRSTVPDLHVGICSACHPFFTGEQRFVDTAGRVDKFQKRFGAAAAVGARRKRPKLTDL